MSKHVKKNLDQATLKEHVQGLELLLEQPYLNGKMWLPLKTAIMDLTDMLQGYLKYLKEKCQSQAENRNRESCVRDIGENREVLVLQRCALVKPTFAARYKSLMAHLEAAKNFEVISVDDYTPDDTTDRRYYIDNIAKAVPVKSVLLRVAHGNNIGTYNFLWKVPVDLTEADLVASNAPVIAKIEEDLPKYHTRVMRKKFINTCSLICSNVKPAVLRYIYRTLTGDSSSADSARQQVVDSRVEQAFEMEDPDIILDLREHNKGQPCKYETFFEQTAQYLESVVEVAAHERRQDQVGHLSAALSVRDLREQVAKGCPEGTAIPSEQWLRLQFAPKNPAARTSLQYTGKLNVKYAVQSRQFRMNHPDTHYAAALFRYMREFAVQYRQYVSFACQDDKHHVKVGEPGNPVAAVDRGKRVITAQGVKFAVSDHDFTKWSVVPSVTMLLNVPDTVVGSFYRGQVWVGVKDLVLEPSSPLRHVTELVKVLESAGHDQPILLLYTDGGPDHRCTYLSVQLALFCLFIQRNYDMIIAVRTPPQGSWRNPPERIMSILNLALQCVGMERQSMDENCEGKISSCSSLKALRQVATTSQNLKEAMRASLEPVKVSIKLSFTFNYKT